MLQLYAWRFGHGLEQKNYFWFPILNAKSRRLKEKKLPWLHFDFLSSVFGVLGMANAKK
jgi:hypothetical protein